MRKFLKIAFIVVAVLTVPEYLIVCGMFTAPLMLGLVGIFGIANVALALKDKHFNEAALYLIATVALSMGYWKVLF